MEWQTFAHEADVGIRGSGPTVADAFAGAATAMTSVICDPDRIEDRVAVTVECAAPDDELLLVDWLNALIYEMATRGWLFARFRVAIAGGRLSATAWGEPVQRERHQPAVEVKGATYTTLRVAREDGYWVAQTVVDV